jgi:hypothetical protein
MSVYVDWVNVYLTYVTKTYVNWKQFYTRNNGSKEAAFYNVKSYFKTTYRLQIPGDVTTNTCVRPLLQQ